MLLKVMQVLIVFTFYFFDPELHLNDTGSGITKKTKKNVVWIKRIQIPGNISFSA